MQEGTTEGRRVRAGQGNQVVATWRVFLCDVSFEPSAVSYQPTAIGLQALPHYRRQCVVSCPCWTPSASLPILA
jgi:hypothetical protein